MDREDGNGWNMENRIVMGRGSAVLVGDMGKQ